MKRDKIIYWTITILFAAFMLLTALPDILLMPDAITLMNHLGYPNYFIRFIGIAKALGAIAVLVPRFPRIKEWAYAGLFFDLFGATYSQIAVDCFQPPVLFMLLPLALLLISYRLHHNQIKPKTDGTTK